MPSDCGYLIGNDAVLYGFESGIPCECLHAKSFEMRAGMDCVGLLDEVFDKGPKNCLTECVMVPLHDVAHG